MNETPPLSSQSSDQRRWTISHDTTAEDDRPQAFRLRGPEIAFGSVEVMPVTEHARILRDAERQWRAEAVRAAERGWA